MATVRTSVSDPLRIASLRVPGLSGALGLSFCPGKVQPASSFGRNWQRDLDTDLAAIRTWGATLVVSLVETEEMKRLSVEDLGATVRNMGMIWLHLPIPDLEAPDSEWDRRWLSEGRTLVTAHLHRGERVLVHCKGGLGRAGTVSALILIEQGMTSFDAIVAVRAARSQSAIETGSQEEYLHRVWQSRQLQAGRPEHL